MQDKRILSVFVKQLTYEVIDEFNGPQKLEKLSTEEIVLLLRMIESLYRAYKYQKSIRYDELGGNWGLLSLHFANRTGICLYALFEKLISSPQDKQFHMKEEDLEDKSYYNCILESEWYKDKNFLKKFRILEDYNNYSENRTAELYSKCRRILQQVTAPEDIPTLQNRMNSLCQTYLQKCEQWNKSKLNKQKLDPMFICSQNIDVYDGVISEPDMLIRDLISCFAAQEEQNIKRNYSCKNKIKSIESSSENSGNGNESTISIVRPSIKHNMKQQKSPEKTKRRVFTSSKRVRRQRKPVIRQKYREKIKQVISHSNSNYRRYKSMRKQKQILLDQEQIKKQIITTICSKCGQKDEYQREHVIGRSGGSCQAMTDKDENCQMGIKMHTNLKRHGVGEYQFQTQENHIAGLHDTRLCQLSDNSNYLLLRKQPTAEYNTNILEDIRNIDIRVLGFYKNYNIYAPGQKFQFIVRYYPTFLESLRAEQERREEVNQLIRQFLYNTDDTLSLTAKIFITQSLSARTHVWSEFWANYIRPMKYRILLHTQINLLTEIINLLFTSPQNQDIDSVTQIKYFQVIKETFKQGSNQIDEIMLQNYKLILSELIRKLQSNTTLNVVSSQQLSSCIGFQSVERLIDNGLRHFLEPQDKLHCFVIGELLLMFQQIKSSKSSLQKNKQQLLEFVGKVYQQKNMKLSHNTMTFFIQTLLKIYKEYDEPLKIQDLQFFMKLFSATYDPNFNAKRPYEPKKCEIYAQGWQEQVQHFFEELLSKHLRSLDKVGIHVFRRVLKETQLVHYCRPQNGATVELNILVYAQALLILSRTCGIFPLFRGQVTNYLKGKLLPYINSVDYNYSSIVLTEILELLFTVYQSKVTLDMWQSNDRLVQASLKQNYRQYEDQYYLMEQLYAFFIKKYKFFYQESTISLTPTIEQKLSKFQKIVSYFLKKLLQSEENILFLNSSLTQMIAQPQIVYSLKHYLYAISFTLKNQHLLVFTYSKYNQEIKTSTSLNLPLSFRQLLWRVIYMKKVLFVAKSNQPMQSDEDQAVQLQFKRHDMHYLVLDAFYHSLSNIYQSLLFRYLRGRYSSDPFELTFTYDEQLLYTLLSSICFASRFRLDLGASMQLQQQPIMRIFQHIRNYSSGLQVLGVQPIGKFSVLLQQLHQMLLWFEHDYKIYKTSNRTVKCITAQVLQGTNFDVLVQVIIVGLVLETDDAHKTHSILDVMGKNAFRILLQYKNANTSKVTFTIVQTIKQMQNHYINLSNLLSQLLRSHHNIQYSHLKFRNFWESVLLILKKFVHPYFSLENVEVQKQSSIIVSLIVLINFFLRWPQELLTLSKKYQVQMRFYENLHKMIPNAHNLRELFQLLQANERLSVERGNQVCETIVRHLIRKRGKVVEMQVQSIKSSKYLMMQNVVMMMDSCQTNFEQQFLRTTVLKFVVTFLDSFLRTLLQNDNKQANIAIVITLLQVMRRSRQLRRQVQSIFYRYLDSCEQYISSTQLKFRGCCCLENVLLKTMVGTYSDFNVVKMVVQHSLNKPEIGAQSKNFLLMMVQKVLNVTQNENLIDENLYEWFSSVEQKLLQQLSCKMGLN